jgi:acetyl esterase/lipase
MTIPEPSSSNLLAVDDYVRLPSILADHRLTYGSDPAQFGDLYLPSQPGPHPVVVLLHGGCWRGQYGLAPLGQLCTALTAEGLAVWNIEYRRLGNGGGWPATFLDVATAADALRDIAGQYALDLARVVAMGHSAGGHLALWLAGRHRLPPESPLFSAAPLSLRGVIALAAVPDLVEGVKRDLCRGAIGDLIGGSPDAAPERYRQASPIALLPLGVPQRHIAGRDDLIVPADYLEQYVAVAAEHDDVRLDILAATGHFEPVVAGTDAWAIVKQAVLELLAT